MNFFKKRKAAKESNKSANVIFVQTDINGGPHLNHANGFEVDEDCSQSTSPKFDLSLPSEVLPQFPTCSRLSKSLEATLKDDAALGQFIQFMETEQLGHLVRFWLDAESFRITARSRLRSELNAQHKGISAKDGTENSASFEPAVSPSGDSLFSKENRDNTSIEAALSKRTRRERVSGDPQTQTSQSEVITKSQTTTTTATTLTSTEQPEGSPDGSAPPFSLFGSTTSALKLIEKDAVAIYQKYICPNVTNRLKLTDESYHSIVSRICCEDGCVDPRCFVDAQSFVFEEMRKRFPAFRQSEYHLKYQIDLLTSAKLTLSDILYYENALVHFMEFVEIEGGLPLIQFWLLVENFSKLLRYSGDGNIDSTTDVDNDTAIEDGPSQEDVLAQSDAIVIYDKYFSLQATEALGFGDQVRFQVEANICTEDGRVDARCFDTPVQIVLNLLAKEYLQPFLQSSIYFRWLSELINNRRLGGIPSGGGYRPRTGSDASSSEASVGSSSLATGLSKKSSKKREKKSVQDLLVESRIDVDDPDALWRRKHNAGPLIFGKINPMGDYRSELGFHPDTLKKKGSSRITKALKSLVQDESEIRAREDMAAQIAQMVINDVTSLTMGKPAFEPELDDGEEAVESDEEDP